MSDLATLVRAARKGDADALAELVRATQDRVFRFCFYLCGNRQLAQDLTQDTFLRALESIRELKNPERFESWLLKAAKNLFLDHLKSPKSGEYVPIEEARDPSLVDPGESPRILFDIRKAMKELSEEDRLILLLVDLEEYSYAEAAEIIGISDSSLRFRLHHIRKSFAERYRK